MEEENERKSVAETVREPMAPQIRKFLDETAATVDSATLRQLISGYESGTLAGRSEGLQRIADLARSVD